MKAVLAIVAVTFAVLLYGCSKHDSAETKQTVEQSKQAERSGLGTGGTPTPETLAPPASKAKSIEVIHDKQKVDQMVKDMKAAYERRQTPANLSVRPTPSGMEAVIYNGKLILEAKKIEHWDVALNGNILVQAQLSGEKTAPDGNPETDTEGQEAYIDPLGVWVSIGGATPRRLTPPNVFAGGVAFSPSGQKIAISEIVRNEKRWPVIERVRVVDVATNKSLVVVTSPGHDGLGLGEWLSETKLQVITVGEASYNALTTYEIPTF